MSGRHNLSIVIRPAAPGDLPLLHQWFPDGPPEKHAERFAAQQEGKAVYLLAWSRGRPVGHCLLKWEALTEKPLIAERLEKCSEIEDLFVHPDLRSQGIGLQLLRAAEQEAARRGYQRMGLGVATDNPRARSLYERDGYRDSGFGEHRIGGTYVDEKGCSRTWQETCIYFLKDLPRAGALAGSDEAE